MRFRLTLVFALALLSANCAAPAAAPTATPAPAAPTATTAPAPSPQMAVSPTVPSRTAPTKTGWSPQKPIEFVVHTSAGSGSDIFARTVADILTKERLISQPITVVNKVGGQGAVAFSYVAEKKQDPHVWLTATSSFYTTPLTQNIGVNYKNFTVLTVLAKDDYLLMVNVNSPYQSLQQLIDDAKSQPGKLRMAGTNPGSSDSIATRLLQEAASVEFTFVPFEGGGEAVAALLGGHVEMAWANPLEAMELMKAGRVRPLAVTSEQRLKGLPDVPTFKELGYPLVFQLARSIAAPADLPPEAIAYYDAMFKRLTETSGWQAYLEENMVTPAYMDSAAATRYAEELNTFYAEMLKRLGVIQ